VSILPPDPVADADLALNHLKNLTFARRASNRLGLNEDLVADLTRHGLGLSLYGVGGNPRAHLPSDIGQACLPGTENKDGQKGSAQRSPSNMPSLRLTANPVVVSVEAVRIGWIHGEVRSVHLTAIQIRGWRRDAEVRVRRVAASSTKSRARRSSPTSLR
jgi:hypothetical protein